MGWDINLLVRPGGRVDVTSHTSPRDFISRVNRTLSILENGGPAAEQKIELIQQQPQDIHRLAEEVERHFECPLEVKLDSSSEIQRTFRAMRHCVSTTPEQRRNEDTDT